MADIVLFQPKSGIWDAMGVRVPTGLLSIASVPVSQGRSVVLIDSRIDLNWQENLRKEIEAGAKIVCFTTMVGEQILHMMEASKFVKTLNSKVMTVLGGSWAQIYPGMCMQDMYIDIVCAGEGDYLLSELLEVADKQRRVADVPGIYYRGVEGAKIKKTEPRKQIEDLDELPGMPWELVDMDKYLAVGFRPGNKSVAMVTSRGCQFRCGFCSIVTLYKQTWRGYSVERIMSDLDHLEKEHGIKDFFFMDDLITGDFKRFENLVEALHTSGKDYNWSVAGIRGDHVLRLKEETLQKMVESGCKNIDIGVESGNPRMLKLIKKDTTVEVIRRANQKMAKYPIIIKYTFMGGFPTETEEEFKDTLALRRALQEENEYATAPLFFYTPFHDSPLYQTAIDNGFVPPTSLKDWADFNYNTWYRKYPSWLSNRMIRLVENSAFLSYFSNKKLDYKYTNPLFKRLFRMYYPIAKFRYEHDFYAFMVEKSAANFVAKMNQKFTLFGRFQGKKLVDDASSQPVEA
jgi:anaerobic magnesium-protoporphyrin IX monomethyl ester cyclase